MGFRWIISFNPHNHYEVSAVLSKAQKISQTTQQARGVRRIGVQPLFLTTWLFS
jgi:hypothetical protein